MGRKINRIVVHHTAIKTTTQPDDSKMISSMKNNHKVRIGQFPDKNGSTIAYHFYVSKNGKVISTRDVNSIGYANSNWPVNKESINIVAHGNFDKEIPTNAQYKAVYHKIQELKNRYGNHITVHGHKEFANKSCPGVNFKFSLLKAMMLEYEKMWNDNFKSIPEKERIFKNPEAFLEKIKNLTAEEKDREYTFLMAILFEKIGKEKANKDDCKSCPAQS